VAYERIQGGLQHQEESVLDLATWLSALERRSAGILAMHAMPSWTCGTPVPQWSHILDNARNFDCGAAHDETALDRRKWDSDTFTIRLQEEKAGRL
jgi:hypothetical protein